ncbi:unnamed protein product [Leptidea sinapis]|uniref:Acyltransferase 3 domain-containing protein n=1 Tax=Leptidea sinapis TaxID=189913 RepID=A0A5E4PSP8_9NEOP|nr:unnamed protein product [Leptidea sinapis]
MVVLTLAFVSTTLDLTLSDHARKERGWALSWSVVRSWRALTAGTPRPRPSAPDLRTFDGLRVFCMMAVILEHVCWLASLSYVADARYSELTRRDYDAMLMTNSTLVVQIFFLMASFLLAHKILQQRRKNLPLMKTFFETILNRIVRISPSNFVVVWFVATWMERLGDGPLWKPLVGGEAAVCRRKWWTHLIYMNNVIYPDDKCLIQTWYLAADMQLYVVALLATLLLRGRRAAVPLLAGLFIFVTGINFTLACLWRLVPTFVLHRPESVLVAYGGEPSFNVLYQSPLGNASASLAGLLLAHLHHALGDAGVRIADHKVFRAVSVLCAPAALGWAALSPRLLGGGVPHPMAAAALAALERPVFVLLVTVALLGAINGVKSWWRTWLSHFGSVAPRLSFGALLLHLSLNKALLATRLQPIQLDRPHVFFQWFGVGVLSYSAAIPLALLVEFPTQRLYKEVTELINKYKQPTQDIKMDT